MADINKDQIKIMASEVLADTDDGGGQMTSNEIVSGNVNNMFPSISRLNRITGESGLRKGFVSVQTDTRALFLGSHISLTKQTSDPRVSVTLFSTKDWFDIRDDCQTRIEGYLVKGPMYPCGVWGDHYYGSKTIQVFVEKNWKAPKAGEVLVLITNRNLDGQKITKQEQFVRITGVKEEVKSFIDQNNNTYEKKVLQITFSDKLLFDLPGTVPSRSFSYSSSLHTLIHTSVAADTSKYYGVSNLKTAATKNSMQIQVDSIRQPIVPSAQSQSAITDFGVGMAIPAVLKISETNLISKSIPHDSTTEFSAGFSIAPGSLDFTVAGNKFTDNSKKQILDSNFAIVGIINYGEGRLQFDSTPYNGSTTATLKALPAVEYETPTETGFIPVSESNRGYVYVFNCVPVPEKGTLRIDFLSSGKWYSLYDQGNGQLKGIDKGIGSGTLNYDTGSVSMTLGGMPDIGSKIIVYWGTVTAIKSVADLNTEPAKARVSFVLSETALYNTLNLTVGGMSIEDVGDGVLQSEGSDVGTYTRNNKKVTIDVSSAPDLEAQMSASCSYDVVGDEDYKTEAHTVTNNSDPISFVLDTTTPLMPNTITGTYPMKTERSVGWDYYAKLVKDKIDIVFEDDGNGVLKERTTGIVIGSVDYAARAFSFNQQQQRQMTGTKHGWDHAWADEEAGSYYSSWRAVVLEEYAVTCTYDNQPISVKFIPATAANSDLTEDILTAVEYQVNIPEVPVVCAGSVNFKNSADQSIIDIGTGELKNLITEQMEYNINYATGIITPKTSLAVIPEQLTNISALVTYERSSGVYSWTFRCPGSPITPGSFTIQATKEDGSIISATAGLDGVISSVNMQGTIEFLTGIVEIAFGDWVPKADHEGEYWVNDAPEDGNGNVFKPIDYGIQSATIIMNCVVQTYLPLDAELIGMNPVKLPIDGKVPVFRDGDIVLIHHSAFDVVEAPSPGQVFDLSRNNVNLIELYDNNGVYVPEVGNYSVDLADGQISFEDPLDLSAYSAPFQAMHRIEDSVIVNDVQITGHMSLTQPLLHDYPAEDTLVSSVLAIGNMQARVYNEFSDSSWGNIWSDVRQFNNTTAQYDFVNYPVITTNKAATRGRFALIFTGPGRVAVVSEQLGVILSNAPIADDISPLNSKTGLPYFRIRREGWGAGWNIGEVLRFNMDAANYPFWICRTTLQGPATESSDDYVLQTRGDSA